MLGEQPAMNPSGELPSPQTAKPKTNRFAIIAASLATLMIGLAAGIAIGTNIDDDTITTAQADRDEDSVPAAEGTRSAAPEPEPKLSPTPIPTPTPTGPELFVLGEGGTYSEDGEPVGTITVETAETLAAAPDEYSDPPVNGVFLTVSVVATALDANLYDVNPWDFYVRDTNGNRWDLGSGNGYYRDDGLDATTLNGGETVRGTISFDVPPEATQLVYAPMQRAIGVWDLTTSTP